MAMAGGQITAAMAADFESAMQVRSGALEIRLDGRNLDDAGAEKWCLWAKENVPAFIRANGLQRRQDGFIAAREVNFSNNSLGDIGVRSLLRMLYVLKLGVRVLKLFKNCMGRAAASALMDWMVVTKVAVQELHLSHNYITREGAVDILKAVAYNGAYPVEVQGRGKMPLWLRLEHNIVQDAEQLLQAAEEKMKKIRQMGATEKITGPMLAVSDVRRDSFSDARCPLAQVTYLAHQRDLRTRIPAEAQAWSSNRDQREEARRWSMNITGPSPSVSSSNKGKPLPIVLPKGALPSGPDATPGASANSTPAARADTSTRRSSAAPSDAWDDDGPEKGEEWRARGLPCENPPLSEMPALGGSLANPPLSGPPAASQSAKAPPATLSQHANSKAPPPAVDAMSTLESGSRPASGYPAKGPPAGFGAGAAAKSKPPPEKANPPPGISIATRSGKLGPPPAMKAPPPAEMPPPQEVPPLARAQSDQPPLSKPPPSAMQAPPQMKPPPSPRPFESPPSAADAVFSRAMREGPPGMAPPLSRAASAPEAAPGKSGKEPPPAMPPSIAGQPSAHKEPPGKQPGQLMKAPPPTMLVKGQGAPLGFTPLGDGPPPEVKAAPLMTKPPPSMKKPPPSVKVPPPDSKAPPSEVSEPPVKAPPALSRPPDTLPPKPPGEAEPPSLAPPPDAPPPAPPSSDGDQASDEETLAQERPLFLTPESPQQQVPPELPQQPPELAPQLPMPTDLPPPRPAPGLEHLIEGGQSPLEMDFGPSSDDPVLLPQALSREPTVDSLTHTSPAMTGAMFLSVESAPSGLAGLALGAAEEEEPGEEEQQQHGAAPFLQLDLSMEHPPEVLRDEILRQRAEIEELRAALATAQEELQRLQGGAVSSEPPGL